MELKVQVREVYGKPLIYPANDAAKLVAELVSKSTLSPRDLKIAMKLGHTVVELGDPKLPALMQGSAL